MKTEKAQIQASATPTGTKKDNELPQQVSSISEPSSPSTAVSGKACETPESFTSKTNSNSTTLANSCSAPTVMHKVLGRHILRDDTPTPAPDPATSEPFIDILYNKINSVLGGTSQNQFLTLMLPGQSLNKDDFSFNLGKEEKNPIIEEKESNLANKLYDACTVSGGDNGMTLQYQYQSALDNLSPKLNGRLVELKNSCRELLQSDYYYDFCDGKGIQKTTIKDVFFRLFDEYIEANQEWALEQENQRRFLKNSKGSAAEVEFQRWFAIVAPAKLQLLDEKYAKVLAVFSPNDMKILEGVIDSGIGSEIQRCRDTLRNFQRLTPYGGTYYPVNLQPSNWFTFLETNFTPVDLLDSSRAIRQKISDLKHQQNSITIQLANLSSLVPDDNALAEASKKINEAITQLNDSRATLIKEQGEGAAEVLDAVSVMISEFKKKKKEDPSKENIDQMISQAVQPERNEEEPAKPEPTPKQSGGNGDDDPSGGDQPDTGSAASIMQAVANLFSDQKNLTPFINNLTDSAATLSESLGSYINKNNLKQFEPSLTRLKSQLLEVEQKLADATLELSIANQKESAAVATESSDVSSLATKVPEGFMQVLIDAQASTLSQNTSQITKSSVSTSGTSFFFCGHSHTKQTATSDFEQVISDSSSSIQIAMNVAKIGIERPWFNPGVFALTKDMFRLGQQSISAVSNTENFDDNRFIEMNSCIFPCYPVALLVARDVSIRFSCSSTHSKLVAHSVEEHSRTGGGFLIFAGSKSTDNSNQTSSSHVSSTSNSVTIRFDTPQIIGVYQEVVHPDFSTPLQEGSQSSGEFVSILKFIQLYKESLERLKKSHENLKRDIVS